MIAVDTLTRSITVKLGGVVTTNQATWVSSYQTPSGTHLTLTGVTTDATEVTIVPPPDVGGAGGVNQLMSFSLLNQDTVAVVLTVTYKDSAGVDHQLQSCTLQTGETLGYENNSGWCGLDVNGNQKVASNNVQVSTALSTAQQASTNISNLTLSVARNSTSLSTNSVSMSSASQNISILMLTSSQASSMHTALGNEALISSVASRTKSSFGW